MKRNDIIGREFGNLTVIKYAHTFKNKAYWLCMCSCGNEKVVIGNSLLRGKTKSCGCIKKTRRKKLNEPRKREKLYKTWCNMKARCLNKNNSRYKDYGERGITIYPEWINDFSAFKKWSLNNGYNNDLTIERTNNNGNYEPNNCKWIPLLEQANNKRTTLLYEYGGEQVLLSEYCKKNNLPYQTIYMRINRGMNIEKALKTEIKKRN